MYRLNTFQAHRLSFANSLRSIIEYDTQPFFAAILQANELMAFLPAFKDMSIARSLIV